MRVLGLCSYPVEAAATRFRMAQFVGPLRARGIELEIRPFLSSEQFKELYSGGGIAGKALGMMGPLLGRMGETIRLGGYDAIFVQREAMIFGPGFFEWLYRAVSGMPMVLDLDDATYVRYVSPSYGRLGSFFKFFGKTDNLIRRASAVTCGNRFIAEYVESKGSRAEVIPTVVDTDVFRPAEKNNLVPALGWIGTHSTYPFLESLFPVLERLADKHEFVLRIVGAGRDDIRLKGVEVENLPWEMGREVEDFRDLDIGLYPMTLSDSANREWLLGKSGFKAIQYLAVGVPFVMTPIGVAAEIGENGRTHFNAETPDDWYNSLDKLLSDGSLRLEMGRAGREESLANYTVEAQVEKLADVFGSVGRGGQKLPERV